MGPNKLNYLGKNFLLLHLGLGVALSGCGSNPYKETPKKCKIGCDPKSTDQTEKNSAPRLNGLPLSLEPKFWDANSARTVLTNEELTSVLTTNPFLLIENALRQEQEEGGVSQNLKAQGEDKIGNSGRCHTQQFHKSALKLPDGSLKVSADYGRCFPLSVLTKNVNKNNNGNAGKQIVISEYEAAFQLTLPPAGSFQTEARQLIQPAVTADVFRGFPFRSISANAAQQDSEGQNMPFTLSFASAIAETKEVWENGKRSFSVRTLGWTAASADMSPNKILTGKFSADGQNFTINGSIFKSVFKILNPTAANPFNGEKSAGITLEFEFFDFKFTDPQLRVGTSLGFSNSAKLDGVYLIRVNDSFANDTLGLSGKAQSQGGSLWLAQGLPNGGEPCLLELYAFNTRAASESDKFVFVKNIDICRR